jgi:tetratricopeptide (TPR) repeat protein
VKFINYLIVLCFSLTMPACVSSINTLNANKYADAAFSATEAGDWDSARRYWARAVVNAELAKMPPQQFAVFNYEYGRALGVQCFFDEAERYLLKAYELDRQTVALSLCLCLSLLA